MPALAKKKAFWRDTQVGEGASLLNLQVSLPGAWVRVPLFPPKVISPCNKKERKNHNWAKRSSDASSRKRTKGLINPFCSRKRCGHTYYANATDKALAGETCNNQKGQQTGGTRVVANCRD